MGSEVIQTLGKYEIIAEQGRGGMGVVYKARDPIIGRIVALKTLTSDLAENPDSLKRFYREAQAAGNLQHPNLVTIFDLGEASGQPYIAMEFVEGESLRDIIAQRPPMPLPQRLKIIRQFCSGLAYAHEHGLVHRDVKPANILIRKDGTAKVVDFGIVHVESTALTKKGMFLGTVQYASPEQLNDSPVDQRSDIFSVGVVIYEFLGYQRPFDAPTVASVLTQILTKDPVPLAELVPGIPPQLGAMVARCLQKEPENRYASLQDLILELDPIASRLQRDLAADLVSQVPDLITRHDLARARDLLHNALMLDSSHSQAKALMNEVNSAMRRIEVSTKVGGLIAEGKALLERRDYAGALETFEEAVKLDSRHEEAVAFLAKAREKQAQASQIRQSLSAAKNAYRNGDLTDAELTVKEVLQLDSANSDAQTILAQIQQERADREKRFRLREALWEVRNLLDRTRYEDATLRLAGLQLEFPQETEVAQLVVEARQKSEDFRGEIKGVKALLETGRFQEAAERAGKLAVRFSQRPEVIELYESAKRQSDFMERRRVLGAHLTRIQQLIDGGEYVKALEECEASKERFPESVELDRLTVLAKSQKLAEELEREVQACCRRIQALLDAGRFDEAAALAEGELARFPGSPKLVQLLVSTRRSQFEAARQSTASAPPVDKPFEEDVHEADKSIESIFAENKAGGASQASFENPLTGEISDPYSATQVFTAQSLPSMPSPAGVVQPPPETLLPAVGDVAATAQSPAPFEPQPPAVETEAQPVTNRPFHWLKPGHLLFLAVILVTLALALVWVFRKRPAPPPPALVALAISTSPAGAAVAIDGRDVGPSPVRPSLSPGRHQIEAKQVGYDTLSQSVDVAEGMTPIPTLALTALPLKLQVNVPDLRNVTVKWDDESPAPVTSGQWSRDVEASPQPQTHTLEITAGGATGKLTVEVTAGATPEITFESKPKNLDLVALTSFGGQARAQFGSPPATVSVDGQPYDLTPAAPGLNNLAGAQHTLSWDDGAGAITEEFETGSNPAAAIFFVRTATLASKSKAPKTKPSQPPPPPTVPPEQQKIADLTKKAFDAEQEGKFAEPDQDNAIFYANQVLQLDSKNAYAPQIVQFSFYREVSKIDDALQAKDFATADRMVAALAKLRPGDQEVLSLQKQVGDAEEAAKPHAAPAPKPVLSNSANLIAEHYEFFGTLVVIGHRLKFVWTPGPGPKPPQVDLSCADIKEVKQDRAKGQFHVTTKNNQKYEFLSEQVTGNDVQGACAKP